MLLLIPFVICIVVLLIARFLYVATWCGYLYRFDHAGQCISREWVNSVFIRPPAVEPQDSWQRLKTDLTLRCGDFAYERKARYKSHGCFIFSPAPLHWDDLLEIRGLLPKS